MSEKKTGCFDFESREAYEEAKHEVEMIKKILERTDISDPKIALKLYNKIVADKMFETVTGYFFLLELRQSILESGLLTEETIAPIPIKEKNGSRNDIMPQRNVQEGRFQRLYEGQILLNKKFKIIIAALLFVVLTFVVINVKFEYTIFTYFTNYKANMEEEIIDKYEKWEEELKIREDKLKQYSE